MSEPRKFLDVIPYPTHPILQQMAKSPVFLWRAGLGPLIGRLFLILTTTGRKSGLPRRTAVEYHKFGGRKYIVAGWPNSDWYRNIQADPRVTIQTSDGVESVVARRLTEDEELTEAYENLEGTAFMRGIERVFRFHLDKETFLKDKDRFIILTFDPTGEPTPPPQPVDLPWLLPALFLAFSLGRQTRSRRRR